MKPLRYREIFDSRGRALAWLHHVRNLSGAYVIRKKSSHEILYIGESHSGALAKTIKRHFYSWKDESRRHVVLNAARCEVAVRLCPPLAAKSVQNKLINTLQPEKNITGFNDAPF